MRALFATISMVHIAVITPFFQAVSWQLNSIKLRMLLQFNLGWHSQELHLGKHWQQQSHSWCLLSVFLKPCNCLYIHREREILPKKHSLSAAGITFIYPEKKKVTSKQMFGVKLGTAFQMFLSIFICFFWSFKMELTFCFPSLDEIANKPKTKTHLLKSTPVFLNTQQTFTHESYLRNVYRNHLRNILNFPIQFNIPNKLRMASFTVFITSTSDPKRKDCEDKYFVLVWV